MPVLAGIGEFVLAGAGAEPAETAAQSSHAARNTFRREGDFWTLTYGGTTIRAKDAKGLRDLAHLIAHPGREIHAAELYAAPARGARATGLDGIEGDAGPAIDEAARAAYKERIVELEADLAEAEADNDTGRITRARAERDALLAQLSSALGLGGRARAVGDPNERARKAVTQRIKDAIARIEREHDGLARHLSRSVRTGTFCSYEPEEPVDWVL
jgi:hypothetical protein